MCWPIAVPNDISLTKLKWIILYRQPKDKPVEVP